MQREQRKKRRITHDRQNEREGKEVRKKRERRKEKEGYEEEKKWNEGGGIWRKGGRNK